MRSFKRIIFLILFFLPFQIFSQSNTDVEMADILRTNGKIYVVVVGLVIILTGVTIFLLRIERKLNRLENRGNPSNKAS